MRNCLVAQSGGPTSVINASVVGVVESNREIKYYDKVFAGINGVEGILNKKIKDITNLTEEELYMLKHTPASALSSCRYKLKDYKDNEEEYKELFNILDEYGIQTMFYIGGNDSMDTVSKLSQYAKEKGINKQIIGIPKTIDNDLCHTDHTPGYGSAAKYIASTVLETYLDASVYTYNGIFIIETMGRDTGWLAASSVLAEIKGKPVADFIYLPEKPFSIDKFLVDVKKRFEEQNMAYIVVSEGIRDKDGNFLFELNKSKEHDAFSHSQLGGVSHYLKQKIITSGITSRVKALELGVTQRCAMHNASQRDIDSAYKVGSEAVKFSANGDTGIMAGINRVSNDPYTIEIVKVKASDVANSVKYFPKAWINEEGNHIKKEAIEYIRPLIKGTPKYALENDLPKYFVMK